MDISKCKKIEANMNTTLHFSKSLKKEFGFYPLRKKVHV